MVYYQSNPVSDKIAGSMETIIAEKITFGGNSIAKLNGKTVFVPFAVPGERLEVEITARGKDYDSARLVRVIEPSPLRVSAPCPYYGECGGCNMMHIEKNAQTAFRAQILKDAFERNGVSVPEIEIIAGEQFGYRSRFQLNDGGLSKKSSNEIIPIERCLVAEEPVNEWLSATKAQNRPRGRCHLFGSSRLCGGKRFFVAGEQKKQSADYAELKKKNRNIRETKKIYAGTSISEADAATVALLGKQIRFDVRGFFQSNLDVLEKAIAEICRDLHGSRVLDMYAGCGTFSVFLADLFEHVTLVEHNRDALVFAEMNLAGKKHESFGLSGAKWLQYGTTPRFDAVVIDPPRRGMEKDVRDFLCRSDIPLIRSVSCDPATHARDLAQLVRAGYRIRRLFLLDFYPNTSHVESLAVLEK